MDPRLAVAPVIAAGIGLFLLSSIPDGREVLVKQAAYVLVGLAVMVACIYVDYEFLPNAYPVIFWANLVLLALVQIIGRRAGGAQNWIDLRFATIQPGEFAKLAVIATLAVFFSERPGRALDVRGFAGSFLRVVGPPLILILVGNELGQVLVLVSIWVVMVFVARAKIDYILAFFAIALLLFGLGWRMRVLPPHHVDRLLGFMAPEAHATVQGYQYLNTWIAVGSGEVFGQGHGRGPMTQLEEVPAQRTDMIFSALAEEQGFVGCVGLLAIYAFILLRGVSTIREAKDDLGRYLAAGISGYLAFHVVVNVGMSLGLMPIVGIPLPMVSYGGSNLVTTFAALGLLMNVHMRRKKIAF